MLKSNFKGQYRPNAITQRDAILMFSKVKKTPMERNFEKYGNISRNLVEFKPFKTSCELIEKF